MSRLTIVRDDRFRDHLTPDMHPECPERIEAIDAALQEELSAGAYVELPPRKATEDEIASIHSSAYVEDLASSCEIAVKHDSLVALDADTFMSPKTFETAKLAAGAALVGIDSVFDQQSDSCFVAVRPPGHHALKDKSMGFCLFNNIAVAARYAQKEKGVDKVFILDWDVHHGNGTQHIFYDDPSVFFASMHQHPNWPPGSGRKEELGVHDGTGRNMNVPLPPGTGDRGYLAAFDRLIKPACLEYEPDMILVSAGYDAHKRDPLAHQEITTIGFAMMAQRLADLRDQTGARVVCLLEGGYDIDALSESVLATIRVLNAGNAADLGDVHASYLVQNAATGDNPVTDDLCRDDVDETIDLVAKRFSEFWKSLC